MFIQEWKNLFKNKIMVLSIFVIALIPIIYAGILLSSYWDPFGKTSNLAVAVVNEDTSQNFEGTEINIGEELVNNLKTNDDFNWNFVDAKDALPGYENGDYYMIITIPKDFSKNATSVLGDNVKKMNLEYKINPGRNYFAETISKQAISNINNEISESVTKEYAKTIFSIIEEIGDGFSDASEGANKINDGTEELKNGSFELTENLKKLSSSTLTFQSGAEKIQIGVSELGKGANSLKDGSSKLNDGIIQYTDGVNLLQQKTSNLSDSENGIPKLVSGQNALNDGLKEIQNGGEKLEIGLNDLNNNLPSNDEINQLISSLNGIQNSISEIETLISIDSNSSEELKTQLATLKATSDSIQPKVSDALNGFDSVRNALGNSIIPGSSKLNDGISTAVFGSNTLTTATNELANNIPSLTNAINQLAKKGQDLREGSHSLLLGTDKLASSVPTLSEGINQLTSASGQISNATSLLADGSSKLNDGLVILKDGTEELSTKLSDGSNDVNSIKVDDNNYDMISSPVETVETKDNDVPNYGHALAPNFVSLALFIGAIAFNLIFPIATASKIPTSATSWWFSKFSIIFVQSTFSALVLDFVLLEIINLEVANKVMFILISILVALTYMSLVSFLVVAFDNPGRFIATIFMVLQLASSGGMFPTELQSSFFQAINPYMLMTYSVFGFREAMTNSINHDIFVNSIIVLITTFVLANIFMLISMFIKKKFNRYESN